MSCGWGRPEAFRRGRSARPWYAPMVTPRKNPANTSAFDEINMHFGLLSILNFFHTIEDCRKKWILLVVSAGRDVLMSEPHRREWTWCGAHFSQGLITSKLCRVIWGCTSFWRDFFLTVAYLQIVLEASLSQVFLFLYRYMCYNSFTVFIWFLCGICCCCYLLPTRLCVPL